jgi:hypothetical protein
VDNTKIEFSFADEDEIALTSKIPRMMINPGSVSKSYWNLAMLVLIIFIAIIVPYRIPFEENISNAWLVIDELIDTIFLIDIILNFLTVYEDD